MVWTALWMFSGSYVIVLNNELMNELNFPYPFMISAFGQLYSAAGGLFLTKVGVAKVRAMPSRQEIMKVILPVAIFSAATNYTGNDAYTSLSVTFIQILKGVTPGVTMLISIALGQEEASVLLLLALCMIGGGTGVTVLVESGTSDFQMRGFIMFMISSITESLRVAVMQVMMEDKRYSTFEGLLYISFPTGVILLGMAMLFEPDSRPMNHVRTHAYTHIMSYTMAFATNLTGYYSQKHTSALTFKVNSYLKNFLFIIATLFIYKKEVTLLQVVGYLVSGGGFIWYTYIKTQQQAKVGE